MHRGNESSAAAIRPRIFADLKGSCGVISLHIQHESISAETINNEFNNLNSCERY